MVNVDTFIWNMVKKSNFGSFKTNQTLIIADSSDKNFNYIPKNYSIPHNAKYVHYTSNNTIFGTQMNEFQIRYPL